MPLQAIDIPSEYVAEGGIEILRMWVTAEGALNTVVKLPGDPQNSSRLAPLILRDLAEAIATKGGQEPDPGGARLQQIVAGFLKLLAEPSVRPRVIVNRSRG